VKLAEPFALIALVLVPLVLIFQYLYERRRERLLAKAGDPELLSRLMLIGGDQGRGPRWAQAALFAGGLALAALALARPQFGMTTETKKGRGMDVVLALDLSRSMLAQDVVPSRLERSKIELTSLIDQLGGDRVGLLGFTSVALPLSPLTVDHSAVKLQLKNAGPSDLPRGGTAIGAAIEEGKRMLESARVTGAAKAIVVLTDGEENEGDPEKIAGEAKAAGIEVHVVGVGSKTGEPIPLVDKDGHVEGYVKDASGQTVVSRLNEKLLTSVADAGGGLVALPSAIGGLDLSPVRNRLATLKKAELEDRVVRIYEERYAWALVPAFVLLLLAALVRPARRLPAVLLSVLLIGAGPFEREDPDAQAGNRALVEGKPEEAIEAYRRAAERLKKAELTYNEALAQGQKGELDAAIAAFKSAAEAADTPGLRSQSAFSLGNAYRKLKKYDEAIDAYRRSLLEDPSNTGARRNLEIAKRMKAVQAAQPKKDDPNGEKGDQPPPPNDGGPPDASDNDGGQPDASDPQDGSNDEAGQSGQDGSQDGGSNDPQNGKDGGGDQQDAASPPQGGEDGGTGQDGGSSSPPPQADEGSKDPNQQEAEQLLDALRDQEKALKRKKLMERFKGRGVAKDW
jgi:Ca-activated chloride channel homolog